MEIREFLAGQVDDAHAMLDIAVQDVTDSVAHWQPGGTANTIAQLLAHMVMGEDNAVNRVLKGGGSLFEAGGWSAKTGIPAGRGAVWEKGWRLHLDAFNQYRAAVQASAREHIGSITPADLDKAVTWGAAATPRSVSWLVRTVLISHIFGHAGEISALKGLQGLKGLPF